MSEQPTRPPEFWRHTRLQDMSREQWESLCDGCGQCCSFKLEDQETGEVINTEVACELLDVVSCRCSDYANRRKRVPGCVHLTPQRIPTLNWLPETCGYRLVSKGEDLPAWHPLRTGEPESVHEAGVSVRGKVYSAAEIGDVQKVLAQWYDLDFEPDPDDFER